MGMDPACPSSIATYAPPVRGQRRGGCQGHAHARLTLRQHDPIHRISARGHVANKQHVLHIERALQGGDALPPQ